MGAGLIHGGTGMLGIKDPLVFAAYLLSILSTIFCVIYGALSWNRGDESAEPADRQWADREDQVGKDL